jgi:RND family efflux transporter MFP subunit
MKQVFILILLTIISASCANDSKSLESLLETNDLQKIQQKRAEIVSEQAKINLKIKQIDLAISKLDTLKKYPLVTAFQVKQDNFDHFLELQGSVATKKNIILYPEFSGLLTSLNVVEGQKVSKGELLGTIDDGGLSQQLAQLDIQLNLAKTTYERQQRLWEQKIGSELEYLQAKANYEGMENAVNQIRSQVAKTFIRAPFSGIIDNIITEQGTVVSAGMSQIIRLVNLDNMYIEGDVPESYLSSITKGKTVEIYFPILGEMLTAKVSQVSNYIKPDNRTFTIKIDIPNKNGNIKPNLTAKIKINNYSNKQAILIPQSIISENSLGEQYIYIANKNKNEATANRVIIKTGRTQGDYVEILEGLSNGDTIVNEGARSVKDGQKITILKLDRNE